MRILFVHEVNYRSKVVYEMHEFPELLALDGHEVAFFHFPERPAVDGPSFRTRRQVIPGRAYGGATITLVTPPTFGGSPLERYLAPILNIPSLRREIRHGGYDLIFLYAVPTTGWQTVAIARSAKIPTVFRALDVSHLIRKTPLAAVVRLAERFIYKNVDLLSANNGGLARYCVESSGRTKPTSVNLPPLDLQHFAGESSDSLRQSLRIGAEKKVLLYMGSFFPFSGLENVVEGFARQRHEYPDLMLVLIGGGEIEERLRSLVIQLELGESVIFTGVVAYRDLPRYLSLATVAINPFVPQLVTNVALPHKVLQYMAAGVPAVSTRLEGLWSVLGDDAGVTWAASPNDVVGIATALAYSGDRNLKTISEVAREALRSRFSERAALDSLEESIASIL